MLCFLALNLLSTPILTLYMHVVLSSADFKKIIVSNYSFRNTIRVSNSLEPDQARHFVGPDLGPNCLQRLSADDTSRQRVKYECVL